MTQTPPDPADPAKDDTAPTTFPTFFHKTSASDTPKSSDQNQERDTLLERVLAWLGDLEFYVNTNVDAGTDVDSSSPSD